MDKTTKKNANSWTKKNICWFLNGGDLLLINVFALISSTFQTEFCFDQELHPAQKLCTMAHIQAMALKNARMDLWVNP